MGPATMPGLSVWHGRCSRQRQGGGLGSPLPAQDRGVSSLNGTELCETRHHERRLAIPKNERGVATVLRCVDLRCGS